MRGAPLDEGVGILAGLKVLVK